MSFIFDERTAPDFEHGGQSIRFCMVNGNERATCQIGRATLNELGPKPIESDNECLDRFFQYRGRIAAAATRLLRIGVHRGGTIIQILRANMG